jgi:glyoxylase-like metal-dependent hydrolase (beta-lactamase superfamily II)
MSINNCNTFLIDGPTRILIDPGHTQQFSHVEDSLKELGLDVQDIGLVICTHSHPDHIEAVQILKETSALVAMHQQDWEMAQAADNYMITSYGIESDTLKPDFFLQEGTLSIKGMDLEVLHTPGHSPGSISLYWPQGKMLVSGDLIFNDGIGRTDIPGGSAEVLKQSVTRLTDMDVDYLLPGHGDIVSGNENVKMNFSRIKQFWFTMI